MKKPRQWTDYSVGWKQDRMRSLQFHALCDTLLSLASEPHRGYFGEYLCVDKVRSLVADALSWSLPITDFASEPIPMKRSTAQRLARLCTGSTKRPPINAPSKSATAPKAA